MGISLLQVSGAPRLRPQNTPQFHFQSFKAGSSPALLLISSVKKVPVLLILLAFQPGCTSPEAPEFRTISNLSVDLQSLSQVRLKADAVFYNPNKHPVTLKDVDLGLWLEGTKVATIQKEYNMPIPKQIDFNVPIEILVNFSDLKLSIFDARLGVLGNKGKEVHYKGRVRLKSYGVVFSVPVDYTDTLYLRF